MKKERYMAGKNILVIDDDVNNVDLVKIYLNRDGHKVSTAYDGREALKLARESHPDLIVLDLMLPGTDGLDICRTIRRESDVPIIMLTARTTEEDRLKGLELGADDYVTKPFSPRELAARVRTVLRRIPDEGWERGPVEIQHEKLVINFKTREVSRAGRPVSLTPIEFKILGVLIKEPGRVFSRAQIIQNAIGYDFEGFDRTIDVHILNLRRKLELDSSHPRYIKTVYGTGYKFGGN